MSERSMDNIHWISADRARGEHQDGEGTRRIIEHESCFWIVRSHVGRVRRDGGRDDENFEMVGRYRGDYPAEAAEKH